MRGVDSHVAVHLLVLMSTPKTEETKPATPTAQPVAATSTTNTPAPASSTFTWPAAGKVKFETATGKTC